MERYKGPRPIKALLALGVGVAVLAGCATGQDTPPTPDQIVEDAKYFELPAVLDANGEPVQCVMYGSGTNGTKQSKSWFGFDCDFEGTAQFPGEPALTVPVTTEG